MTLKFNEPSHVSQLLLDVVQVRHVKSQAKVIFICIPAHSFTKLS